MIKPAFRALLVPGVGPPPLLEASLLAASGAAIAMAAVAVRADEKHRATLFAHANSLPENPFAVNRHHAFSQAGGRQRQRLRGRLEPAEFGRPHEGRRTRNPVALTAGFLHFPAFPDTITPCSRLVDDRTDDRAFGADDVAPLGPKFRKLRFQMIADSRPAPHCAVWCGRRNQDGRLSRTIYNSKTSWDSIPMRGGTGPAGITTSAWS
jgi:hypothetical protein